MRSLLFVATATLLLPVPAVAQDAAPTGLARVELERSRQCVPVLARIAALEAELEPLAQRSQRVIALGQAVALEDRTGVEPFDEADATEAAVARWFERDRQLAETFLNTGDEAVQEERTAAREEIKALVNDALVALRNEADSTIAAAGELTTGVGGCEGAILVRSAVLEACETTDSPVCAAARAEGEERGPYRFVDSPENLWDVQEMRPWTSPAPLTISEDGQIGGARTVGYARNGNLTLTLAFAPLLGDRESFSPEELERFAAINDSAGFRFEHPDVAFAPSLSLRASAPEPLAGESLYVLHFGLPDEADVVWTGEAGTGEAVQATVAVSPGHLVRLGRGEPLRFTAVRQDAEGDAGDAVFSVEFTPLNQAQAVQALMGYMAESLSSDLAEIVPPSEGR